MRKFIYLLLLMLVVCLGCEDNAELADNELVDRLTAENNQLHADLTQLNIGLASVQAALVPVRQSFCKRS